MAARVSGFRLPVVEVQEIHRVAGAEVVAALDFRQVGRQRVRPLVAIDRIPSVTVAGVAESGLESRITRIAIVANTLIVRARNAQDVETIVARLEVRTEHILILTPEPERHVHQHRR